MKEREETMVVKITGAVFIVLCGAFAGLYRSKILQKQADYIEQYISFLTQAQAMISYSYANITEILENVNSVPLMNLMIKQCRGKMKNGDDFERAWSSAVFGSYQRGEITKADHEMICRFSEGSVRSESWWSAAAAATSGTIQSPRHRTRFAVNSREYG